MIDWNNIDYKKVAIIVLIALVLVFWFAVGSRQLDAERRLASLESGRVVQTQPDGAPVPETSTPDFRTVAWDCRDDSDPRGFARRTCSLGGHDFVVLTLPAENAPYILVRDGTGEKKCRLGESCTVSSPGLFDGMITLERVKKGEYSFQLCRYREPPPKESDWQVASSRR